MDIKLEKALEFSNYMVTLNNQKRLIHEQYIQDLVHYYNGGQFSVTQELISFCQSLLKFEQDDCVLVDDNKQPIFVDDLESFTHSMLNIYATASNTYFTEYDKIRKNRSVEGILTDE